MDDRRVAYYSRGLELTSMSENKQPIKKRILLAASKFFSEREYREVTLEEIAEAAGIGKSTIYGHFKSKDLLFFECLNLSLDKLTKEVAAIIQTQDFENSLKQVTKLLFNKTEETGRMMITICENTNTAHQDLLQLFKEWLKNLVPLFEAGIASGKLRTDLTVRQMTLLFLRMFDVNIACMSLNEPVFTENQLYNIIYNALKK
jgi:AcrR family transcriptional regulator